MSSFRLSGISYQPFERLFELPDEELRAIGAVRRVATEEPGFPCRVSLQDAQLGEELLLLPYVHLSAVSPYRASGPIFVRRNVRQCVLPQGEVPPYVSRRLISVRAYDALHMMVDATVCDGKSVAEQLERTFSNAGIAYAHLHNAKQGCFSCLANRVP